MTNDPWAKQEDTTPPAVAAEVVTSDYRGDHAADVRLAVVVDLSETVGDFIARAGLTRPEDHIEVRLAKR